jgi:hypothetical protein
MSERILVIDPGERVGYCVAQIIEPKGYSPRLEIESHGISALKDFAMKLAEVFPTYDTVVYETYRIAADKVKQHIGSDVPTLQLIGMIRLLGWLYPEVKLVPQGPELKKTGVKFANARLEDVAELLGRMPKTHDDAHDGDAVMHAAAYLFKTRVKR